MRVILAFAAMTGTAAAEVTWLDCSVSGNNGSWQFRVFFDEAPNSAGMVSSSGTSLAGYKGFSPTEIHLNFHSSRTVRIDRITGRVTVEVYDSLVPTTHFHEGRCALSPAPPVPRF